MHRVATQRVTHGLGHVHGTMWFRDRVSLWHGGSRPDVEGYPAVGVAVQAWGEPSRGAVLVLGGPSSASWERGLGPAQRHAGTGPRAAAEGREHRLRGAGGTHSPRRMSCDISPLGWGFVTG